MKEFYVEIIPGKIADTKDIKGEALLLKAFKRLKIGRYRCQLYSTNKRSVNQNSYIHVVFTLAQKALYNGGYRHVTTMQAAKDWFKERHLKVELVNDITGEKYPYIRHTSELSKEEMTWFIEVVREECLDYLGTYIPTPEEYRANYAKYDLIMLAA